MLTIEEQVDEKESSNTFLDGIEISEYSDFSLLAFVC